MQKKSMALQTAQSIRKPFSASLSLSLIALLRLQGPDEGPPGTSPIGCGRTEALRAVEPYIHVRTSHTPTTCGVQRCSARQDSSNADYYQAETLSSVPRVMVVVERAEVLVTSPVLVLPFCRIVAGDLVIGKGAVIVVCATDIVGRSATSQITCIWRSGNHGCGHHIGRASSDLRSLLITWQMS